MGTKATLDAGGSAAGAPGAETVKIRGLVRFSGWTLAVWGAVVFLKGFYDLFRGEPEANLYAPKPWAFVSREQWLRYAGFELAYGLSAAALAAFLLRYSRFVPETVRRPRREPGLDLFK